MNDLPQEPWHMLHIDHCGPFHNQKLKSFIQRLLHILLPNLIALLRLIGYPQTIRSNKGPTSNSPELSKYTQENGIDFKLITWP